MCSLTLLICGLTLAGRAPASAAVRVNPSGVNVNTQGATTVFLTFGGLVNQTPAEAFWCGELIPAAPDIGSKCDPATIFGQLPFRFDQSRLSGTGGFTDIMSIPPSVARRAYQAAQSGQTSTFFYVRRFISTRGGRDEYVAVTCRLAGGGARVPFSLVDVRLAFASDDPVLFVRPGQRPPALKADLTFTGTGRLKGRWEVVLPGDEPPTPRDLLTEATLPIEERGRQRRYAEIERFNVFLPPTGRYTLPGPDPARLPTTGDGTYLILLRVEASDDKEADSSLAAVGAGAGLVHSGAIAGFSMPALRYIVGGANLDGPVTGAVALVLPADGATLPADRAIEFTWLETGGTVVYRLEILDGQRTLVLAALVPAGVGIYRSPLWLKDRTSDGTLWWRIVAIDVEGHEIVASEWRTTRVVTPQATRN
ncbi:MAG: hypothetical protein WD690_09490 [Vicinamibacterales bacterium]